MNNGSSKSLRRYYANIICVRKYTFYLFVCVVVCLRSAIVFPFCFALLFYLLSVVQRTNFNMKYIRSCFFILFVELISLFFSRCICSYSKLFLICFFFHSLARSITRSFCLGHTFVIRFIYMTISSWRHCLMSIDLIVMYYILGMLSVHSMMKKKTSSTVNSII